MSGWDAWVDWICGVELVVAWLDGWNIEVEVYITEMIGSKECWGMMGVLLRWVSAWVGGWVGECMG